MRTQRQERQANPKPNMQIPDSPQRLYTVPHCKTCDKPFKTRYPNHQIYCNDPCKFKAPKSELITKHCQGCGSKFETVYKVMKYCQKSCRLINKKKVRDDSKMPAQTRAEINARGDLSKIWLGVKL